MLQSLGLRKTVQFQSRDCHDETGLIPCLLLITICSTRMNLFYTMRCFGCNLHRKLQNNQGEQEEDKIVTNVAGSQPVLMTNTIM